MPQMYKLFINSKVVYLCQNPAFVENLMHEDFIIEPYKNAESFSSTLSILLSDINKSNLILFARDVESMLRDILSFFVCLEAAGGVVSNPNEEILLIFRRGYWDLPKGKIEKHEKSEDAAVREVEEETGLKKVRIICPLGFRKWMNKATYHSYLIGDKPAMKITHWYIMHTDEEGELLPQTEEDIEIARWVPKQELPDYFPDMYPSIVDVLKEALA